MNEKTELDLSAKPAWLELPDKREYWCCYGESRPTKRSWFGRPDYSGRWVQASYSKEDAEAFASGDSMKDEWRWDGEDAKSISLSWMMSWARKNGRAGVAVKSFVDGNWVTVKKYHANEPLPEDIR